MPKKKEDTMTFAEKCADYTVLSEEEKDGKLIAKIRTHSGYIAECIIPIRTPEEEAKFAAKVCKAMVKFVHPEMDLSRVKHMEVVLD